MTNDNILHFDFSFTIGNVKINATLDYPIALFPVPTSSYLPHSHAVREVYLLEDGQMTLNCMSKPITMNAQDILIIDAQTPHHIVSCSDSLKRISFRFTLTSPENIPATQEGFKFYQPKGRIASEIKQTLQFIRSYIENPPKGLSIFRMQMQTQALFSFIIEQLIPEDHLNIPGLAAFATQQSKLSQCIKIDRFFAVHYGEQITLAHLAEHLNYSHTQTNRILREYYKMSFTQKLLDIRYQNAVLFLTKTDLSIETIAEKCGYTTRRGFESMFFNKTGMTPFNYRKNLTDHDSFPLNPSTHS